MAEIKIPDLKAYAALLNEPARGSRDPKRKADPARTGQAPNGEAGGDRKILSISQYQDPRDTLDQERHQRPGIGGGGNSSSRTDERDRTDEELDPQKKVPAGR